MTEHLNQAVDAEPVDLTAHKIAYSWLRHFEKCGRRGLGEAALLDQLRKLDHQVRPELQIQSLFGLKAEVGENVPARFLDGGSHSALLVGSSELLEVSETATSEIEVGLSSSLGLLFERVEDVDRFGELRDVEDSMFKLPPDSNLSDAASYCGHGLPVRWHQPLLDSAELVACGATSLSGKGSDVSQRGAEP